MTLSIESGEEISGNLVYVSGGAAVSSGGIYELKFSEYEKVVEAQSTISTHRYSGDVVLKLSNIISGNVVAVQAHKVGAAISGVWAVCQSGDVAITSGVITVVADCI